MIRPRHAFWVFANLYGRLLGRPFLAPLHAALLNLSLHGLGYDNALRPSFSGEEWFVRNILAKASPRVCIDIGANVGRYSRLLLARTSARVYAIEPSGAAFAAVEAIAKTEPRLAAVRTALSDHNGEATLYGKSETSETATLDKSLLTVAPVAQTVPVATFDTLVERLKITEVDFVKIDTEGFEAEVLAGMRQSIARFCPQYIQFEFNIMHLSRGVTLLSLARMMEGYEFYRLLPRGWLRIDPERFSANIYMFSNIVAKRID